MRAERALGLSGRAAGIENRRRVIRCYVHGGQVLIRQIGIIIGPTDNIFQRAGWSNQCALAARHDDMFQIWQIR